MIVIMASGPRVIMRRDTIYTLTGVIVIQRLETVRSRYAAACLQDVALDAAKKMTVNAY